MIKVKTSLIINFWWQNINKLVANWIDNALDKEIPNSIEAFCFNIYELTENKWSMEIVCSEEFE